MKTLKKLGIGFLLFHLVNSVYVEVKNLKISEENNKKFQDLVEELEVAKSETQDLRTYVKFLSCKLDENDIRPDEFDIVLRDALY